MPIGVLGLVLTHFFIQNSRAATHQPFDIAGFTLSGASLSCLLFGFETGSRGAGETSVTLALIGAGVASGAAYVAYALRQRTLTPILDLSLMRIRTFRVSVVGGSLCRITQGAQPFLLPLMMQVGFGMSAAESGLLTFATGCGAVLMKAVAARPAKRRLSQHADLEQRLVQPALRRCAAFGRIGRTGSCHPARRLRVLDVAAIHRLQHGSLRRHTARARGRRQQLLQHLPAINVVLWHLTGALALTVSRMIGDRLDPTVGDFSTAFLAVTVVSLIAAPVCFGLSDQRRRSDERPTSQDRQHRDQRRNIGGREEFPPALGNGLNPVDVRAGSWPYH